MYERVRAQLGLRETCAEWHCEKVPGGIWAQGTADVYGLVFSSSGQPVVKAECRVCGRRSGAIPHAVSKEWGIVAAGKIEWVIEHHETASAQCVVNDCTNKGAEWHHFAPRNTFGDQADLWPCLPLCRAHHHEWHTRMDGYRWHAKRAA